MQQQQQQQQSTVSHKLPLFNWSLAGYTMETDSSWELECLTCEQRFLSWYQK